MMGWDQVQMGLELVGIGGCNPGLHQSSLGSTSIGHCISYSLPYCLHRGYQLLSPSVRAGVPVWSSIVTNIILMYKRILLITNIVILVILAIREPGQLFPNDMFDRFSEPI